MVIKKRNLTEEFTIGLSKLEAVEFIGVCKVLGVALVKDNDEPREFRELLLDSISSFSALNRKQKRDLVKLVAAAGKR
jgi:hypothetical protein